MTFALLTDASDISEITLIDYVSRLLMHGSSAVSEYWGAGQEVKISFSYIKF